MKQHIEKLPWDTEFFSVPIGRITSARLNNDIVSAILQDANEEGLRCLYFEADPNDLETVLTAECNGFHLVDVRVVLEYSLEYQPVASVPNAETSDLIITAAMPSDIPCLEEIAIEIGQFSRYSFDPLFGPEAEKRLYRAWINNSFNGLADIVFVARSGGRGADAVGLISCTAKAGTSHIQLAGVHHGQRKKGIGTGLVQAALSWANEQKTLRMEVVTQARNVPAQRLYQQMGFFTKSMSLYYHKWL
jgi:GNAT superfamily N-acetyltransferase